MIPIEVKITVRDENTVNFMEIYSKQHIICYLTCQDARNYVQLVHYYIQ